MSPIRFSNSVWTPFPGCLLWPPPGPRPPRCATEQRCTVYIEQATTAARAILFPTAGLGGLRQCRHLEFCTSTPSLARREWSAASFWAYYVSHRAQPPTQGRTGNRACLARGEEVAGVCGMKGYSEKEVRRGRAAVCRPKPRWQRGETVCTCVQTAGRQARRRFW